MGASGNGDSLVAIPVYKSKSIRRVESKHNAGVARFKG